MNVQVNGADWELPPGATVADVLDRLDVPPSGVAVALDGAVVPRAAWLGSPLRHGSSIEVFTAVQGG